MRHDLQRILYESLDQAAIESALHAHLRQLVIHRDPFFSQGGHRLVQQYVQTTFSQWGAPEPHTFDVNGRIHTNWILRLPARELRPQHPIIVGAHYDAVPNTPGADDNASGVALLLELARFLKQHPPRVPVWLTAFDMEEYGLLGSRAYATELKSQRQAVRFMMSLEMLGYCDRTPHSQKYPAPWLQHLYPHTGDFIALVGNLPTLPTMHRLGGYMHAAQVPCAWLPVPNRGQLVPATRRSDHAAFWDCGYRAMMVTDTAFLRNPHYHQPSDRIATLDLKFMTGVCCGLMMALHAWR